MVTAVARTAVRAVQPIVQTMVSTVVQAEVAAVMAAVVAMVTITCDHRTGSHENCGRSHEQNVFHHMSPLQTV